MKKGLLICLITVIALSLQSCFYFVPIVTVNPDNPNNDKIDSTPEVKPFIGFDEDGFMINQLNGKELSLYNKIDTAVADFEKSVSFEDGFTYEQAYKVYNCVVIDHPQYFWLSGGCDADSAYIYPEYTVSEAQASSMMPSFESAACRIAALADKYTTDYDIALFVHDYLAQNVTYDKLLDTDIDYDDLDTDNKLSYSAYGAIINGLAVCAGYSAAYQYILTKCGVECVTIFGDADGPHAWNIVGIEGEYYYVDILWDDYDDDFSGVPHEYFLVTEDTMSASRTVDEDLGVPECTSTEYNYFVVNDLYFTYYDYEGIRSAVGDAVEDGTDVQFRFSSAELLSEATEKLITDGEMFSILDDFAVNADDLFYYADTDTLVLTVYY